MATSRCIQLIIKTNIRVLISTRSTSTLDKPLLLHSFHACILRYYSVFHLSKITAGIRTAVHQIKLPPHAGIHTDTRMSARVLSAWYLTQLLAIMLLGNQPMIPKDLGPCQPLGRCRNILIPGFDVAVLSTWEVNQQLRKILIIHFFPLSTLPFKKNAEKKTTIYLTTESMCSFFSKAINTHSTKTRFLF